MKLRNLSEPSVYQMKHNRKTEEIEVKNYNITHTIQVADAPELVDYIGSSGECWVRGYFQERLFVVLEKVPRPFEANSMTI